MHKVNPDILEFFVKNYKRGAIAIVGATDPISMAVREGQRLLTRDKKPSLWSHSVIMGDLRYDRRGDDDAITQSPYIFESDLELSQSLLQLRNGAQESWIGKWSKVGVDHAAVIDFGLTEEQTNMVLATALKLVGEQVLYPVQELIGTWLAIVLKKEWQKNPLKDPHAMYCSNFVRYCYREAGADFMDETIHLSNTAPEHIVQAAVNNNKIVIF